MKAHSESEYVVWEKDSMQGLDPMPQLQPLYLERIWDKDAQSGVRTQIQGDQQMCVWATIQGLVTQGL